MRTVMVMGMRVVEFTMVIDGDALLDDMPARIRRLSAPTPPRPRAPSGVRADLRDC